MGKVIGKKGQAILVYGLVIFIIAITILTIIDVAFNENKIIDKVLKNVIGIDESGSLYCSSSYKQSYGRIPKTELNQHSNSEPGKNQNKAKCQCVLNKFKIGAHFECIEFTDTCEAESKTWYGEIEETRIGDTTFSKPNNDRFQRLGECICRRNDDGGVEFDCKDVDNICDKKVMARYGWVDETLTGESTISKPNNDFQNQAICKCVQKNEEEAEFECIEVVAYGSQCTCERKIGDNTYYFMEGEAICQDVKIAAPNSITNRNRDLYVCENGIFKLKTSTGEACGLGYTDFLQNDEPITKDDVDENNKCCCRTQTINGQEVAQCFKLSDENSNECGIYNSNIGAEFFNGEYKLKTENDFKVAKCPYSYQDKPSDCGYFSGEINFYDGNAIVIPVSQAESIVGGATNGLISELTDGLAEGSTDRTVDGAAQEEVGCDIEAFNNNNQYSVTLEGEEVLPFGKKTCDNTMKHIYQCDRTNGMFNLIFCPSDNGKKCIITNNEEGAYCG